MRFKSKSSNIDHVIYDKDKKELNVTFQNGLSYRYQDVGLTSYLNFKAAKSHGTYLFKNILKNHKGVKNE